MQLPFFWGNVEVVEKKIFYCSVAAGLQSKSLESKREKRGKAEHLTAGAKFYPLQSKKFFSFSLPLF